MRHECPKCGAVFTTHRDQEIHRTGLFHPNEPDYGRRCMTEEELVTRGYERNDKGIWHLDQFEPEPRKGDLGPGEHPWRRYAKSTG